MKNSTLALEEFDYCPTLQKILEKSRVTGRTGKEFDDLPALSTINNLIALRSLMFRFESKATLEIGLAFGGSCLAIASTHRDLNHLPCHQHVALDPFQKTVWDDVGKLLIEGEELSKYVEFYEDFSFNALPDLLRRGYKFDLIYIDGSHLFEDVFIDFFYSNKLLNHNGLIVFDDSSDPHIQKVIKFVETNFSQVYQKISLLSLRAGIDKFKYYLASLTGRSQLTVYRKVGTTDRKWNAKFNQF